MKAISRKLNIFACTKVQKRVHKVTSSDKKDVNNYWYGLIALDSMESSNLSQIMAIVWENLDKKPRHHLKIHKTLKLLDYLVQNGSSQIIRQCNLKRYILLMYAEKYTFIDSKGEDQTDKIRLRARKILRLIGDEAELNMERQRSSFIKERCSGSSSHRESVSSQRHKSVRKSFEVSDTGDIIVDWKSLDLNPYQHVLPPLDERDEFQKQVTRALAECKIAVDELKRQEFDGFASSASPPLESRKTRRSTARLYPFVPQASSTPTLNSRVHRSSRVSPFERVQPSPTNASTLDEIIKEIGTLDLSMAFDGNFSAAAVVPPASPPVVKDFFTSSNTSVFGSPLPAFSFPWNHQNAPADPIMPDESPLPSFSRLTQTLSNSSVFEYPFSPKPTEVEESLSSSIPKHSSFNPFEDISTAELDAPERPDYLPVGNNYNPWTSSFTDYDESTFVSQYPTADINPGNPFSTSMPNYGGFAQEQRRSIGRDYEGCQRMIHAFRTADLSPSEVPIPDPRSRSRVSSFTQRPAEMAPSSAQQLSEKNPFNEFFNM